MILDSRQGSKQLAPYLEKLRVPFVLGTLDYGDVELIGRGPGEHPVSVLVEYKKLHDVVDCITTGRLGGHQLPGMLARLENGQRQYTVAWLLVEGLWKPDPTDGFVTVPRGGSWQTLMLNRRGYHSCDLDAYLMSIADSGVRLWRTGSEYESALWLRALQKRWTEKAWEQHHSAQVFDVSGPLLDLDKPSFARRVAKELPGVGWVKSRGVEEAFAHPLAMAEADERAWREVPGIGKTLANRIWRAWRGLEEG